MKHPDGGESRLDVSAKPVTIGRWEKCDIQLDDDSIRPVHVRVVALADGEFRVHGVAAPSLRPFATNVERPDEFMVAQSGDQVSLPGGAGEYVIHFLSTEAAQNLDSPAADGEVTSSPPDAAPAPSIEPPPTETPPTDQPPTDPGAAPPPPASQ
ncbi:MAG TPA: FHA domain-containing protein [Dehalococcoidia bacterium]|nr:FHA domain-containing protein [Dehalococcoidia bacterium]